jgi:hypothetical protein
MAQYFEIKKNSTLPSLKVELIDDGTYDFCRRDMYNNAIQNADITFSMKDENGILKISKAKASIVKCCDCNCTESYSIEYKWNKRDTKESGVFSIILNFIYNIIIAIQFHRMYGINNVLTLLLYLFIKNELFTPLSLNVLKKK